ncbi:MAG: alpha-E domain-containing protein [Myxococcales bacterium]
MISRVADHCFWFGRYLERAESTARLLQVTSTLALDSDLTQLECWQPVIITAGEQARFQRLHGADAAADGEVVQEYLTFNEEVPVCLRRSVGAARENARSVREVVSLEAWESINELHLWIQGPAARVAFDEHRYGFYRHVRRETQPCMGLLRGAMLHDAPLDFIWLGLLLERIGQTARILDVHHHALTSARVAGPEAHPVVEVAVWLSLLRACYGFEPFMKSHRGAVTGEAVAAFLIFESRFPRAIRHCVRRAREGLTLVRPPGDRQPPLRALARMQALEARLDAQAATPMDEAGIHALLTWVVDETQAACEEVAVGLFAVAPASLPGPGSNPAGGTGGTE